MFLRKEENVVVKKKFSTTYNKVKPNKQVKGKITAKNKLMKSVEYQKEGKYKYCCKADW